MLKGSVREKIKGGICLRRKISPLEVRIVAIKSAYFSP